MTTTMHLDHLLDPLMDAMSPEVAQRIVNLRASSEVQARATMLAEKANQGTLSAEEEAEYKGFVDAVDIIAIMQSKARKVVSQQKP